MFKLQQRVDMSYVCKVIRVALMLFMIREGQLSTTEITGFNCWEYADKTIITPSVSAVS